MSKTQNRVSLVLGLLLALVSMAHAFVASDVLAVITAGGRITVDSRFTAVDAISFARAGTSRVTVIGRGFKPADIRTVLAAGGGVVVDGTFPAQELMDIASLGRARVLVDPAGLSPEVLRHVVSSGASLLAGTGGNTLAEKMQTVQNGGQAALDASYSPRDIGNIIAIGRARVHVIGRGFKFGDLQLFTQMGAIVWVDVSTPSPEISTMASTGGGRIIVRSAGFTSAELVSFSRKGAHIVMGFDRDAQRASKFAELHGE